MNIDKIVKEYPKAVKEFKTWYWEKFENFGDTETAVNDITLSFDKELNLIYIGSKSEEIEYRELNYRLLFDYFDGTGIYFQKTIHLGADDQFSKYLMEVIYTNADGKLAGVDDFGSGSLTKAEFEAILIAFEIRNKQIEQNSKEN